MSSLLPEVSLEEETEHDQVDEDENGNSATELQNSSDVEDSNYSSTEDSAGSTPRSAERLPVRPNERPTLGRKLGPYVSEDVDDALEEAYLLLRRDLGAGASKSLIVEAALRFVLNDYLRRGEDSEVANWMRRVLHSENE